MNENQLRNLWKIRFEKILYIEQESWTFYRNILKEHRSLLENTKAGELLEKIIEDEVRHTRIAMELIRMV